MSTLLIHKPSTGTRYISPPILEQNPSTASQSPSMRSYRQYYGVDSNGNRTNTHTATSHRLDYQRYSVLYHDILEKTGNTGDRLIEYMLWDIGGDAGAGGPPNWTAGNRGATWQNNLKFSIGYWDAANSQAVWSIYETTIYDAFDAQDGWPNMTAAEARSNADGQFHGAMALNTGDEILWKVDVNTGGMASNATHGEFVCLDILDSSKQQYRLGDYLNYYPDANNPVQTRSKSIWSNSLVTVLGWSSKLRASGLTNSANSSGHYSSVLV